MTGGGGGAVAVGDFLARAVGAVGVGNTTPGNFGHGVSAESFSGYKKFRDDNKNR